MLAELKKVRFPVETGLLIAFCIFLPLVEMPKNLAMFLYVGAWFANRAGAGELGGRLLRSWDVWDTLFALWITSGYLVAVFAGIHGSELGGAHELARYALLGWLVKRGGYSGRETRWVLGALVVSVIVGLAYGYWRIAIGAAKSGTLQLHSVGHVNHTAIYLAIMLGLCASWTFACWHAWSLHRRSMAIALTAISFVSLVFTASRGAVGVGFVMLLVLAAAWWRRWRAPLVVSVVALAVSAAAAIGLGAEVIRKQQMVEARNDVLQARDGIWRMALVAFERYPWFGIGLDNYSRLTYERAREWRAEAGKDFDPARYAQHAHAHSLYMNALAERGAVGFAALAAVLLAWLVTLVRRRPRAVDDDLAWLLWGGSASAWIVTVGVGTVNTTLHHEHGLLAALLLGLWLSTLTTRRGS